MTRESAPKGASHDLSDRPRGYQPSTTRTRSSSVTAPFVTCRGMIPVAVLEPLGLEDLARFAAVFAELAGGVPDVDDRELVRHLRRVLERIAHSLRVLEAAA